MIKNDISQALIEGASALSHVLAALEEWKSMPEVAEWRQKLMGILLSLGHIAGRLEAVLPSSPD